MSDLANATAVAGADGRYAAALLPEWSAWGPNGGYLAAMLRRAALAHGSFPIVASVNCHFLSVGRFAPVEVEVTTLRRSRRAESVRATMSQDGRPLAEALIWLVADGLVGLVHDEARPPDVPGPDGLRTFAELMPDDAPPPLPMWSHIEGRPITWHEGPAGEPYANGWYRFPAHTTEDAARQLILLDVMGWTAAWNAHPPDNDYIAPNLDLSVQFHRAAPEEEWLLAEGFADVAEDGLIGFRSRVWSRKRGLLASGSGQLLCRRAPTE